MKGWEKKLKRTFLYLFIGGYLFPFALFPEGIFLPVRIAFWVVIGALSLWQLLRIWWAIEGKNRLSLLPAAGILLVIIPWGIAHYHLRHQDKNNRRKAIGYQEKYKAEKAISNRNHNPFRFDARILDNIVNPSKNQIYLHYGPYSEAIYAKNSDDGSRFTIEFYSWHGELFTYDSSTDQWSPALFSE